MQGLCIHAHFYQPPRENPWLNEVITDPSASPDHDWNTRICNECYRPNRAARLLGSDGKISYITNNYKNINFNIGPTLHSWIEKHDLVLSKNIARADSLAAESFGEGGAIAQAYNHMIMPLSSEADKRTQTIWGIRDFEMRFGRKPHGMWLPETAVDVETLEVLAKCGIEFTILAPHQCAAVKKPGDKWKETPGGRDLDVTRPYLMRLPSGNTITLIFYQGGVAHEIAFGGLLNNGDAFAEALARYLPMDSEPRLVVVATDGESYGHHHRFGEMALARALQQLAKTPRIAITNIASFLKKYPATWECKVQENTSWSCAHGLERWRSNCGCHTGGEPGWNQKWRQPLREGLDNLRDSIDYIYEKTITPFCSSPWELRDDAIELYLDDNNMAHAPKERIAKIESFLAGRCGTLSIEDRKKVLSLIDAQRMRMFMYTSCGWFFNDVTGIETRQILMYALRAVERVRDATGVDFENSFLKDMAKVEGNVKEMPTALDVIKTHIMPERKTMMDIAASAALTARKEKYYAFDMTTTMRTYRAGEMLLRIGNLSMSDSKTTEEWSGAAAVISTGGLDDVCRLDEKNSPPESEIREEFYENDILSLSRYIERNFALGPWRLKDLVFDDRMIMAQERDRRAEEAHVDLAESVIETNKRLLVQLNQMGVPIPPFIASSVDLVFRKRLEELEESTDRALDLLEQNSELEALLDEARGLGARPDLSGLAPRMGTELHDKLRDTRIHKNDDEYVRLLYLVKRCSSLNIPIDTWRLQNEMWRVLENKGNPSSNEMLLAEELGFAVPVVRV